MTTPSLRGGEAERRDARLSASARPAAAGAPAAAPAMAPSGGAATSGSAAQPQPPQPPQVSLRPCSLPSCGLVEQVPLDFRVCALCNAVPYCCEAHSAAHWRACHKRECGGRARAAAQPPLAAAGAGAASTPPGGAAAGGGAASASPSAGVVANPPLPPPSPRDVAALRALVEKYAEKAALRRFGRAAEVAGQAADLAFRTYGSDSLVGASLRLHELDDEHNEAVLEPDAGVKSSLIVRARGLLLAAIGVIEQRMAAGTLLPGACREVEVQFEAHLQAALRKANTAPPLSAADTRAASAAVGYDTALHATFGVLASVYGGWPVAVGQLLLRSQAFVLAALETIPRTAALTCCTGNEVMIVHFMEQEFERLRSRYDPAFYSAVLDRWTSPAIMNVLRARGSLQTGVYRKEQFFAYSEARWKADVAARGFRRCGLPSCGKLETTVRHFKLCGGCDAVAYCCDEHHGVHWDAGHSRECRHLRAAGTKPPSTLDG